MHRKSQAAMEFLMTYGWAILVVLVVIGALAYFGVLNPQQFLPRKCQFAQGLVCMDHKLSSTATELHLLLNNGLGRDISIKLLNFTSDNGLVGCQNISATGITLTTGEELLLIADCPNFQAKQGTRLKGKLTLVYDDLQSGFNHTSPGTLLTDVE